MENIEKSGEFFKLREQMRLNELIHKGKLVSDNNTQENNLTNSDLNKKISPLSINIHDFNL